MFEEKALRYYSMDKQKEELYEQVIVRDLEDRYLFPYLVYTRNTDERPRDEFRFSTAITREDVSVIVSSFRTPERRRIEMSGIRMHIGSEKFGYEICDREDLDLLQGVRTEERGQESGLEK